MGGTSRVSREAHARICERLGVKVPGATHRVVTCQSAAEARAAIAAALRILEQLGVQLHPQKTRIVHVRQGFEFLGYKIKRTRRPFRLPVSKIPKAQQAGYQM